MPQNYSISARIDASDLTTVLYSLVRRGVPFGSVGDVLTILFREYMSTHDLEPLTMDQTICIMQDLGLSTTRIKPFQASRSGLPGLTKVVQATLRDLGASTPICSSEPDLDPNDKEIPNV